jgi:hypothetical protein
MQKQPHRTFPGAAASFSLRKVPRRMCEWGRGRGSCFFAYEKRCAMRISHSNVPCHVPLPHPLFCSRGESGNTYHGTGFFFFLVCVHVLR